MNYKGIFVAVLVLFCSKSAFTQCPGSLAIPTANIQNVTCHLGSNGGIIPNPTGGTPPYTYSWSPGGQTSKNISGLPVGLYTLTVTDANGCQATGRWHVNEAPYAGPGATSTSVCKGTQAVLTATGAGLGGVYRWYTSFATEIYDAETTGSFTTPKIKSSKNWFVSRVDAAGCESNRTRVTAAMRNPLYPVVDLDSSLIMHYKFSRNLADSTGRNPDASMFERTLYIPDKNSKPTSALGLSFTIGADDFGYVDFGNPTDLQTLTNKVTISVWMQRTLAIGTGPLINKWQSGNGFYIGTIVTNPNHPSGVERKVLWKISSTQIISNQPIPFNNDWHHIVCVYNGSELQVYQNGVFAGSTPCTGNIPATTVNMLMGRQADGLSSERFSGSVDELRIYNRALRPDEIKTIYNDESVAFSNSPVCAESTIDLSTFTVDQASYQWTGPASFTSSSQDPSITNAATSHAGTYALKVSKNGCTTPSQKAPVVVKSLPSTTISASGPTTFCEGNTITLTAPTAASWLWSTGATTRSITVNQSADYSVRVTNTGGCSKTSDPFPVTVTPVNDSPAFSKGNDIVIDEDVSAQVFPGWATSISAGPGETAQILSFQVSNDNNALFSVQPSVNASGDLIFTPAPNAYGTAQVTVSLKDDGGTACSGVDQSAEQVFTITINPVNDAPSFTKGPDIIENEDAGSIQITGWASNIFEGAVNEAAQALTFQVMNDNNSLFSVQPSVSPSGDLIFTAAANKFGTATVTVTLADDGGTDHGGADRNTQTFSIAINSVNDAPLFTKGSNITIDEDAAPQVFGAWATAISSGNAEESSQAFSFVTSNDNNGLFSVQPAINNSGDLTFTPVVNKSGTAIITVWLMDNGGTALGGSDQSGTQSFTITINAVNDAPSFVEGNDIVLNEDGGTQNIIGWATAITKGPADEFGQTLSFVVVNDRTDLFSIQPALDASGTLTFTLSGNQSGVAIVGVIITDDGGTANGGVDQSVQQHFMITINSVNDAPTFLKGNDIVINEDDGPQAISAWASGISAGAENETSQTLAFEVSNDNNALFTAQPSLNAAGNLTFAPGADVSGIAHVTLFLKDNGGTANGGTDRSIVQDFVITIHAVNDVPSFTKGGDIAISEDAGAQHVGTWATNISAGPANEVSQILTFDVAIENAALFAVPPSINALGDLSFTPAPDVSGISTVSVSLHDNGGTAFGGLNESVAQTFTITINPVNDAPSFTRGQDVVVNEDDGVQTFAAWASQISAGQHESSQAILFQVNNDNNALFTVQPSVDASGDLSFTLAPDVFGEATVTLSVRDDGGTMNGGMDRSGDQNFTITINPVNDAPAFTRGDDIVIYEDDPAQLLSACAKDIFPGKNESTQSLTFDISNDNSALFSVQPFLNAAGDLSFTPASHMSGMATLTLALRDDGGTANGGADRSTTQTFTITIRRINHAPSFDKGQDVVVNEDAATYKKLWATQISAGDPDQTPAFIVSADNANIFAVQPAIDHAGILSFELKPDAFGSSSIVVYLQDNGGTARGGIDRTSSETFNIIVNPINDAPRIDPVKDITLRMNSESAMINLTGLHPGPGEADQQISLEAISSDRALLPTPSVTAIQNGAASLTIYPLADKSGMVTVTLHIHDNGGTASGGKDETTISFIVNIQEQVQPVFVPNFFSPDSNGTNDVFRIRGAGIEQIQFMVYDVNGQELFRTTDISEATETGWNGTYKGKDQPSGVYTWSLRGRYLDGRPLTDHRSQYGHVLLVR